MPGYVLGHHLKGEGKRLTLMSELLDPMHRRYLESLDVVKSGARTLEVGCGNGSISAWLARQVAPDGRAVAVDLDLSLVDVRLSNLEFCKADIMAGPVEPGSFDLVTARAVLHHVPDAEKAMANLAASLRPGGAILLIEPDFLPVSIAEPPEVRAFWSVGFHGRVTKELIIISVVLWRRDWRRWVSSASVALQKLRFTTEPVYGQIIGHRQSKNFARI
jgi:ubiquinone/menaquinone biosynthesis C-methylase UbiE